MVPRAQPAAQVRAQLPHLAHAQDSSLHGVPIVLPALTMQRLTIHGGTENSIEKGINYFLFFISV